MKKYITVAALLAAGTAFANATITLGNEFYTNPNAWVYSWDTERDAWVYLTASSSSDFTYTSGYKPGDNDTAFVGYSFTYNNGVQVMTGTTDSVTADLIGGTWIGAPAGTSKLYLAENAAATGSDNGIRNGGSIYFDGIGSSFIGENGYYKLNYTAKAWVQGDVKLNGSVVMSAAAVSYNIAKIANAQQMGGEWDASSLSVKDEKGNSLIFATTDAEKGKAGYFWVETTPFTQGSEFTVTLHAIAVPEPSAFGMLAGLGALALVASRRRRK